MIYNVDTAKFREYCMPITSVVHKSTHGMDPENTQKCVTNCNSIRVPNFDLKKKLKQLPKDERGSYFVNGFLNDHAITAVRHTTTKEHPSVLVYVSTKFGMMNILSFSSMYWHDRRHIPDDIESWRVDNTMPSSLQIVIKKNDGTFSSGLVLCDDYKWVGLQALKKGCARSLCIEVCKALDLTWDMVEPICENDGIVV